jgi:hypothetical protein
MDFNMAKVDTASLMDSKRKAYGKKEQESSGYDQNFFIN